MPFTFHQSPCPQLLWLRRERLFPWPSTAVHYNAGRDASITFAILNDMTLAWQRCQNRQETQQGWQLTRSVPCSPFPLSMSVTLCLLPTPNVCCDWTADMRAVNTGFLFDVPSSGSLPPVNNDIKKLKLGLYRIWLSYLASGRSQTWPDLAKSRIWPDPDFWGKLVFGSQNNIVQLAMSKKWLP